MVVTTRGRKIGTAFSDRSISRVGGSIGFVVGTVLLVLTTQCSSASSGSGQNSSPAVSQVIGASGGTVTSGDGQLAVAIPAGALSSNVTITIATEPSPSSGNLGTVYEIGPTGTQFTEPVGMTFHYASLNLGSTPASSLRVATIVSGGWQALPGFSEDTSAQTVTGTTTHLSPYTVIASTQVCVAVSSAASCSGGGADASTSGSGGEYYDASASPDCTPTTCANLANACAAYPGATLSCTDGTAGAEAQCCFPEGAPTCVTSSEGCASGGSGGGSGGCSVSCSDAPTICSTQLAGSSSQNCTTSSDNGNGESITFACCLPAGTPLPGSSSGSGGGGGSSDAGVASDGGSSGGESEDASASASSDASSGSSEDASAPIPDGGAPSEDGG